MRKQISNMLVILCLGFLFIPAITSAEVVSLPSNGDAWTENPSPWWNGDGAWVWGVRSGIVGSYSMGFDNFNTDFVAILPETIMGTQDLTEYETLTFWVRKESVFGTPYNATLVGVWLQSSGGTGMHIASTPVNQGNVAVTDDWKEVSYDLSQWVDSGIDWSTVDTVFVFFNAAPVFAAGVRIDGLHFEKTVILPPPVPVGDTDGDGVTDVYETANGTDPLNPDDSPIATLQKQLDACGDELDIANACIADTNKALDTKGCPADSIQTYYLPPGVANAQDSIQRNPNAIKIKGVSQ